MRIKRVITKLVALSAVSAGLLFPSSAWVASQGSAPGAAAAHSVPARSPAAASPDLTGPILAWAQQNLNSAESVQEFEAFLNKQVIMAEVIKDPNYYQLFLNQFFSAKLLELEKKSQP